MRLFTFLAGKKILLSQNLIVSGKKCLATLIESRNSRYSFLNDNDLNFFEKLLGKNRTITDPGTLKSYNVDWLKMCQGHSKLSLLPKTTEELSIILKYCNERKLAVCPQGGNTGRSFCCTFKHN